MEKSKWKEWKNLRVENVLGVDEMCPITQLFIIFTPQIKKMAKRQKKNVQKVPTPKPISDGHPNWLSNSQLHYILIAALAFVLYANTLGHDYCQDDAIVIKENMYTTQGLKGIPGILTKDTFFGFFKEEGKAALVHGGRYRPLTLVLFAVEWQIFGDNPALFHLINILLFALLCLLLYKVMLTLLAFHPEQKAKLIALFTTLIFVTHPIHTEVVANIKGADEIIALLGSLAALYFTLKAYRSNKMGLMLIAATIFGLTIFAKENTITFLAIIPIALLLFGQKEKGIATNKIGKALLYTAPLLVAVIPFLAIRSKIIGGGATGRVLELMNNPFLKIVNNQYVDFSTGEKISTIFYTLGDYVRLLVFPQPLTSDYYPHHVELMHFGDWQVILSILVYVGLFYLAVKNLRKKPLISFGIFIFFASLSIVSNFLFPVGTFMAERFLFMPSVGFSMVIATLFAGLINKNKVFPALGLLGVVLLLFSIKTISRNPAWKNDKTLFLTDVKISTKSAKIQNAVGGTLIAEATKIKDRSMQLAKVQVAVEHLNIAIKEHPNYKNAWLLLGNAYNMLDQYEQSINAYKNALRIAPGYKDAINNMAITYRQAGKYFGEKKGDTNSAIAYLKEAEKLLPDDIEVTRLLGIAYAVSGQMDHALPYMEKAFAATPNNANLALDLSMAYRQVGNNEKSAFYQQKALTIDPDIINKRRGQ